MITHEKQSGSETRDQAHRLLNLAERADQTLNNLIDQFSPGPKLLSMGFRLTPQLKNLEGRISHRLAVIGYAVECAAQQEGRAA